MPIACAAFSVCSVNCWHLAQPGLLFARIDRVAGGGHAIARDLESGQPQGLTDQAIYYILDERRQQAGVEPFTPHDLSLIHI